ncbi:efflux RND transporter periplasmic adaptor subunit [Pararhodospirillum photometricum]|uniref:efflux RND transporter periplasmic adaptor subunit n=1 Tax=Pararhodospirillum photometricum TaxID=1084 RepID=UPI001F5A4D07|nr:efflux RND transporter periplasmic adaptor subunit [Pararhodospirillum photometricum]
MRVRSVLLGTSVMLCIATGSALADPAPSARGLLVPAREAVLSAEIAGRLVSIPVRPGQRFNKGSVLVEFDCRFYQARLAEGRGKLAAAQARLASNQQLHKLNSIGDLDVAISRAEVQETQAVVEAAALTIERCKLTAPWPGRVVQQHAKTFESVEAGKELLEILDDSSLDLEVIVPSSWLAWLKVGAPLSVSVDETGTNHPARISRLGARVDPVSQSVTIYATLDGSAPDLVAGMSGTATFSSSP